LSDGNRVRSLAVMARALTLLPYDEQLAVVEIDPRCQTTAFCRQLLGARVLEPDGISKQALLQQADLAVWCAEHLRDGNSRSAWDLRSSAEARAGNARRAAGEHWSAANAFERARCYRMAGSGCPLIESEALAFEALLLRDRGLLGQASWRLERAFGLLDRGDTAGSLDRGLAAEVAAHHGWCLHHLGRYGEALAALRQAEAQVDEVGDAELALAIRQGQVWGSLQAGDEAVARELLAKAVEVTRRLGSTANQLRLCHAAAHLQAALGEGESAQHALSEVAEQFFAAGEGLDGALALFDLATLRLSEPVSPTQREDPAARTRDLGERVLQTYRAGEVPRVAMDILTLFRQQCLNGNLTAELARELGRFLEQVRHPSLSWWSRRGAVIEVGHGEPSD
jgi:tetratricopeptide (TPR) repeat protein